MKCVICKVGTTAPGTVTATFDVRDLTIVIRNVPSDVCDSCGEGYHDEATTSRLLEIVAAAIRSGVTIEVREYGTAAGDGR